MKQSHRRTDLKCEITSILRSAPIVDNLYLTRDRLPEIKTAEI